MRTDFSKITPCGGDCSGCAHFISGECMGCLNTGGRCVKMWERGCEIFNCCEMHAVKFCGLCPDFPCNWLENKIGLWNKKGIERLKELKEIYERECT